LSADYKGVLNLELRGTYQASSRGFGFFIPDNGASREDDWFVPPRQEGGAWNGDRVLAVPMAESNLEDGSQGTRRTAAIVKILERSNRVVSGAIEKRGREIWLRPGSDKLPHLIRVMCKNGAVHTGDKAAVGVISYGNRKTPALGSLREVFGRDGTLQAAVEAILYGYHIERPFPPAAFTQAERTPQTVDSAALAGRTDLRDDTIITIDGASSKDLDDAVSLARDSQGHWVLGVHIADVSHYVTENSPLDLEAWKRGTSVYFADQVIPMLPPALSNGICSLNPNVDRLTLSCIMTMGEDGSVENYRMIKSVIRSTERMTYADCNTLLAETDQALAKRYADILPMLRDMARLAGVLEKRRRLRGALDLDSRECYVVCDAHGNPVDVLLRRSGISERIIESFMLAANECVAEHLFHSHAPAVYRVHEKPSPDKAAALKVMLAPLGYALEDADSFSLQKILKKAAGTPQAAAVNMIVLRSLMKARYDTENLGHFGLATRFYCHFTSPIRRYPDLMVHRMLTRMLDGTWQESQNGKLTTVAGLAAKQSSDRELAAMNAEREIEKCYMAEYMRGHLGETFEGTVSGVTRFGLFILLANGVEGLASLSALPDDHYEYNESHMSLSGGHPDHTFTFGMPLTVLCAAADPGSGQIDFTLPGEAGHPTSQPAAKGEPPAKPPHSHHGKSPAHGHSKRYPRLRRRK
jgi:ribonuclease R